MALAEIQAGAGRRYEADAVEACHELLDDDGLELLE
jgi:hypothetical protein